MSVPDRNTHRRHNGSRRPPTQGGPHLTSDSTPDLPPWGGRRKKSRSPDSKHSRNATGQKIDAPAIKRKKSGPFSGTSVANGPDADVMSVDRGRRVKSKPTITLASRLNISTENVTAAASTSGSVGQRSGHTVVVKKEKEKEKARVKEKEGDSKSLDAQHPTRNLPPSELILFDKKAHSQDGGFTGPLATAEFKRMQKEIESLRKVVHDNKKAVKKQNKMIEELKEELDSCTKALKDKDVQLQKAKSKSKKSEEIVNSIETSMQCQICLELLSKPFALPPCGHVLCLTCLQDWFRKAPGDDDEMHDDDNPDYLLYRRKTCPCCRAVVISRPLPVFLVKTIATALAKPKNSGSNLTHSRSNRTSPPSDEDPWAGLFPSLDDTAYDESEDQDVEDEDEDEDDDENVDWALNIFTYGSESDEEAYEGDYVLAQWEPPSVNAYLEDFPYESPNNEEHLTMLRRGVTLEMLETYPIEYSHDEGLSVLLEDIHGANRVFLGWNIKLSGDDSTGEEYLAWVLGDIASRPERWEVTDIEDGSVAWEARKLVPFEDAVDYDTTDSENWIDHDDLD